MLLRYLAHDVGIVAELMRVERLAGFALVPDATQSLVDLFLDEEGFRLLDAGFVLRLRQHDGAFYGRLRPLDAPVGQRSASHRQVVPGALPLPLRADDLAPGALQSALRALVGGAPLDLQARVRIERTPRTLRLDGQAVGSLVIDVVAYEWARELEVVHEVKLLLRERTPHDLERLDALLCAYGLEPLDPDRYASVVQRLGASVSAPLLLMPDERRQLRALASAAGLVARRARAILAVANRQSITEVAQAVGMEPERVRFWSERFRWYRLRLLEEGGTQGHESRLACSYKRAEVELERGLPAGPLPEGGSGRGTPGARPALQGRAASVAPEVPTAPPREAVSAAAPSPVVPPTVAGEAMVGETERLRAGVLTRMARVVAHRGRSARERRSARHALAPVPEVVHHALEMPVAEGLEEDLDHVREAVRAEVARVEAAGASVLPLMEAVHRLVGIGACYASYARFDTVALDGQARDALDQVLEARVWEVLGHLLPDDEAASHLRTHLETQRLGAVARLHATLEEAGTTARSMHARLLLGTNGESVGEGDQQLQYVMASTVWALYEQTRQSVAVDATAAADATTRRALAGLSHALHRAVAPRGAESAEMQLLLRALRRSDACIVLGRARAVADAWEVDLTDQRIHRVVTQRLEAALREEQAAWTDVTREVLDRPFRNYLGMVVAAL